MVSFPTTRWSRILGPEPTPGSRGHDFDALARAYRPAVRAWLRTAHVCTESDVEDATQDFFVWLIEHEKLAPPDPRRGRFRAFLKTTLRRFVVERERRRAAHERGAGAIHESLTDEAHLARIAARDPSPDVALDESFHAALVEHATRKLEEELGAAGRAATFEIFREYFLDPEEKIDYRHLAERHGVTTAVVSNELMHAKRRYRALLHDEVTETVHDPETLSEELTWLFGSGAK
jgi:RNA polymerase sigma-70 factor (ECF subfamily)